jgi:LPXTG-motif cell wall-anchored protein
MLSKFGAGRRARGLVIVPLLAGAFVMATAGAAQAKSLTPLCDAFAADASGQPTGAPLATGQSLDPLNIPDLTHADVETGTAFEVVGNASSTTLPDSATVTIGGNPISVTVSEVKNITMHFKVTGASIGQPTLSGGNVNGATAQLGGGGFTLTLPGSQSGSTIGGGGQFFPGGSTLNPPDVTVPVTAPNSPGTISSTLEGVTILVKTNLAAAYLDCSISGNNNIGTINVVAPPPPPPGAPDAVNDSASTDKGRPVTIDVLKNDTKNADLDIDLDSLALVSDPSDGSAVVNADHTVTYTPDSDFTGVDSFQYTLCSQQEVPRMKRSAAVEPGEGCDIATVSVTVNAPPPPTTTTVPSPVTTQGSTAAPATTVAAAAELPRTGSSSTPLALMGAGLLGLGLVAVRGTRRRHA